MFEFSEKGWEGSDKRSGSLGCLRASFACRFCIGLLTVILALTALQDVAVAGKLSDSASNKASRKTDGDLHGAPISLLEAVRLTLSKSPQIQLQQKQTEISRGTALASSGAFDTRLFANTSDGSIRQSVLTGATGDVATSPSMTLPVYDVATASAGPTVFHQNISTFDLGLTKALHNGASISADTIYTRQNYVSDGPVSNVSQVRLTFTVPLLRMGAPSDAASAETAAKIDYTASLCAERYVISQQIYQTAAAYWGLRAAQARLELYQKCEVTALSFRNLTAVLIAADERANAEIHQVDARVAETMAQRMAAEQAVFEARQQLGLVIGLGDKELRLAPLAGDPFPPALGSSGVQAERDRLFEKALLRRGDYLASLKSKQSAGVLLDAARRNLLPNMNFQLQTSYFGGEVGNTAGDIANSFTKNQTGASVVGQVSLEWPFANRAARGIYARSNAQYDQTGIQIADLRRNIASGILLSVNALVSGFSQVQKADAAVAGYQKALDTARDKFRAGECTLLDLIQTEDLLTQASLIGIGTRQQIAQAYARLRFESGTMFPGEGPKLELDPEILVTLPRMDDETGTGPSPKLPSSQTRKIR